MPNVQESQRLHDWRRGDILGLDIGDVLSVKDPHSTNAHLKDVNIWAQADPGCYAFLLLYGFTFGFANLLICTRILGDDTWQDKHGVWHESWGRRFIRYGLGLFDLGLPENQLVTVRERSEKGAVCTEWDVSAFIDDHLHCLSSILHDNPGCTIIQYRCGHETRAMHGPSWLWGPSVTEAKRAGFTMNSWYELAKAFDLPHTDAMFEYVTTDKFPPTCRPWSILEIRRLYWELGFTAASAEDEPAADPAEADEAAAPAANDATEADSAWRSTNPWSDWWEADPAWGAASAWDADSASWWRAASAQPDVYNILQTVNATAPGSSVTFEFAPDGSSAFTVTPPQAAAAHPKSSTRWETGVPESKKEPPHLFVFHFS